MLAGRKDQIGVCDCGFESLSAVQIRRWWVDSPLCWNFPRWHSHRKSSHFRTRQETSRSTMHQWAEFCFYWILIYFSLCFLDHIPCDLLHLPPLRSAPHLSFLGWWWFIGCFLDAPAHSSKQSSTNGNVQYCMLKSSGSCWWPVVGDGVSKKRSIGAKERAYWGVNKWKTEK